MTMRPRTPDRITRVMRTGDVVELSLRQPSLRPLDAEKLRGELVSLHRPGSPPSIVLSMRGLETLSGTCVGVLAEVTESLARLGGVLVLAEVPGETARMLKKAGFARRLRMARSVPQAQKIALSGRRGVTQAA
ncbi:MAG: STAS domain-containing protein [Planctomycetota bacterium]|nr:MAG: STAS domain-containing protein [Planctomycetota bacterium]